MQAVYSEGRRVCKTSLIKTTFLNSLVQSKSCFNGPIRGFVWELKEMYKKHIFWTEIMHLIVALKLSKSM